MLAPVKNDDAITGLQTGSLELPCDVIPCRFKFRRAIRPPPQIVGRKKFDVLQDGIRRDVDRGREQAAHRREHKGKNGQRRDRAWMRSHWIDPTSCRGLSHSQRVFDLDAFSRI